MWLLCLSLRGAVPPGEKLKPSGRLPATRGDCHLHGLRVTPPPRTHAATATQGPFLVASPHFSQLQASAPAISSAWSAAPQGTTWGTHLVREVSLISLFKSTSPPAPLPYFPVRAPPQPSPRVLRRSLLSASLAGMPAAGGRGVCLHGQGPYPQAPEQRAAQRLLRSACWLSGRVAGTDGVEEFGWLKDTQKRHRTKAVFNHLRSRFRHSQQGPGSARSGPGLGGNGTGPSRALLGP